MKTATCNRSTRIWQGRVFEFFSENITLPSGVTVDMEIIRHPGAAAIVPVLADRSILLIRQYRHAVGGFIWEIPAGTLEADEDALACARRELTEETGYRAENFEKLAEITPLPAYSDERIHLFLATDLTHAAQKLDADELLSVHAVDIHRCMQMIHAGKIQDAKTITGLQLAAAKLGTAAA